MSMSAPLDNPAPFDLETVTQELRRRNAYIANGHTARTLVRDSDLRLVVVAMRAGSKVSEHRANDTASVHVLAGRIHVRLPNDHVDLAAGQILVMAQGLPHEVEASSDSSFLLTLGWNAPAPAITP